MSRHTPNGRGGAALAWQNECEGWLALGRAQEGQPVFQVEAYPGLTSAWWQGSPLEMDNYFLVHPSGWNDPSGLLTMLNGSRSIHSLQAASPASGTLRGASGTSAVASVLRFVDDESQQPWRIAAENQGYRLGEASPLMTTTLEERPPFPENPLEIRVRHVRTPSDHTLALDIITEVFGGSFRLSKFFNPFETVQLFLGYYNEQPAASATLWPYAGVAGIYSVATRPRFRRRGLALAVVAAALKYAIQSGFHLASLRTTTTLFPLYQRLGFSPVGQVLKFVKY